jgi:osmoprotectant transport system permease protein
LEANLFLKFVKVIKTEAGSLIVRHLQLVFISVTIAILIAVPSGILLTRPRFKSWSSKTMTFFNVAQGLPSLAVVAIFLPIMGIGFLPSIIALTVYALLPILRNTIAGINSINPDIIESARGMGMPSQKVLFSIEIPLALPVIIAGIQTSAVVTVGTAVIADLIGGGGLGRLIFTGISMFDPVKILAGSILAAIIAIAIDQGFDLVHKKVLTPYKGVRK